MNYLGVDYGEKRIGLAKADGETKIATPFGVVLNDGKVFSSIAKTISEEKIDIIVIGVPISFDGEENKFAERIRKFGYEVGRITLKRIEFENEIFSSKIASQSSPDKADESSAAIILQSYLDKKAGHDDVQKVACCHSRESGNPGFNILDPRVKPEDDKEQLGK